MEQGQELKKDKVAQFSADHTVLNTAKADITLE